MLLFLNSLKTLEEKTLLTCINTDFIRDFDISKNASPSYKNTYVLEVLFTYKPDNEDSLKYLELQGGYSEFIIYQEDLEYVLDQLKSAGLK